MANRLIDRVRQYLPPGAAPLSNPHEVAHCDLLVQTGAGVAFFRVVNPQDDLVATWRTLQNEIARYLSRLSQEGRREGAYLALLVEGPRDPVVLQRIAANPYVCRKVVVPSHEGLDLERVVDELPFFPLPERLQTTIRQPPIDPVVVATGTGFAHQLVEHLLENRSPERICTHLRAGGYDAYPEAVPAMARPASPPPEPSRSDRLFLRKAHLQGFRNYGGAGATLAFTGNLVVIYGRNGTGKTSLCEALEWGLTGKSHRVERARDREQQQGVARSPLLHLLEGDGGAQVDLWLEGPSNLHLRRVLTPEHESRHLNDREVNERDLLRSLSLLADEETPARVGDMLRDVMRHCHFLSQETIQQFLGNDPAERYEAYTYMVGTQNLLRLIEKGGRVARLLEAEGTDHQRAIAQIDGLIAERVERRQERQTALAEAGIDRMPQEANLAAQVNVLARSATLAGVTLEVPELPAARRAQVAAETLIAACPARIEAVKTDLANLERLDQEAQVVPELLQRRAALLERLRTLTEAEQGLETSAHLQEEVRVEALRALHRRGDTLEEAQQQMEQVGRYLALQDDRTLLEGELAEADDRLASLEQERDQLVEMLRRLRSDHRDLTAKLQVQRSEADLCGLRLAQVRRVADRLSEWQELSAEEDHLQSRWLTLRAEGQALSERMADLRQRHQAARSAVDQRAADLGEARQLAQRRQELLAELRGHLAHDEEDCPFCGHGWGNHQRLLEGVSAMLQRLPDGLRLAQEAHDQAAALRKAAAESLSACESALAANAAELAECEARLQAIHDALRQSDAEVAALWSSRTIAALTAGEVQGLLAQAEEANRLAAEQVASLEESLATVSDAIGTVEGQEQALLETIRTQHDRIGRLRRRWEQVESTLQVLGISYLNRDAALADLAVHQAAVEAARGRLAEARRALEATEYRADEARRALSVAREERTAVQEEAQRLTRRLQSFEAELTQASITGDDLAVRRARIATQQRRLRQRLIHLGELIAAGERLHSQARACQLLQAIQELDHDLKRLEAERQRSNEAWRQTTDYLRRVQTLLRQAADLRATEERERLDGFAAMIRLLYQRLCSHPYFGPLDLRIDPREQKLYVRFEPQSGKSAAVNRYFSMAQANAVALAIFLGTALLQSWSRLGVICIDDPVQHMDDMNTFAFLDLLRTMMESGRQLIITTASEELYRTMIARFAPLNRDGATPFQALRMVGVTPEGPTIVHDLPGEEG